MIRAESWDQSAEVVIVGAGGTGLAAALSAAESGASVIVLEKNPEPGGTTGISIGSFTAAGTSVQKAQGIDDDPLAHQEDMGKFVPELEKFNNADLRLYFAHHASQTLHWLLSLGIEFHGPSPEPPNRVPRMHNVVPNAKAYIAILQRLARKYGARFLFRCRATRLVQNEAGRVVGLLAEQDGKTLHIRAERAVILAAGDFSSGAQLKAEYLPAELADIEGINENATGDGHRLGLQVGAEALNMSVVYGPEIRFVPPLRKPFTQLLPAGPISSRILGSLVPRLPKVIMNYFIKQLLVTWQHPEPTIFRLGGILVNRRGERFVDETATPQLAIPRQPDKIAYIMMDNQVGKQLQEWPNFISTAPDIAYAYLRDYRRDRADIYHEARTLDELAAKLGVDQEQLAQTISEYNEAARGRRPDPWDRRSFGPPLTDPPFHALGPVKSYIVTTEGGLRIDKQMRVLTPQEKVIPGLYAGGCTGLGGQILWGHGLHIAWAMTSGRLAGKYAAMDTGG